MKRRKAVKPIKVAPSRSLAWAARFQQRYLRFADYSRLSMLLYVPALVRNLFLLQQRRFSSFVNLPPQLNLSLNQKNVVNTWPNNVSVPQMTLVNLLSLANFAARAEAGGSRTPSVNSSASLLAGDVRRTRYVRDYDNQQRLALTLAVNRTSSELATTFNQKFQLRREAQVREVTTLLTQRLRRVSEPAVLQTPMALRAPAASRVTSMEPSVEAMRSRDAFERRSAHTTFPSITPPTVNVEQLADEVMKQLDRRVIARRERMGQI